MMNTSLASNNRKCLEKNPDNVFAYKELADLCLSKGQYQEAAGMYEDIAQRRNDLKAEMKLSVISCLVMEMDEFLSEDAEGNRERIVELAEQLEGETTGLEEILSILILMVDAYYRNEQYEDALLICQRILYHKPFSQKAIELVRKINEKS